MHLRCIAIDDEPFALDLVKEYVSRIHLLKLVEAFDDAISAAEYLRQNEVDLLFIDINMPDISGIDLLRSLKQRPMAIFTTAYKQYAYEGFELDAIDYLLKPFSFERFQKAVSKASEYYRFKNEDRAGDLQSIFVRSEYQLVRIELAEIEFVESLDDYLKVHLTNGKPLMTLMTMKAIEEKLPAAKFKRIHRSYLVSLAKVRSFSNKKIQLSGSIELPVSNSYLPIVNDWMKQ